jgi:MoaA/NifB/PqqE/SkfB family radical SAM enzyme
MEEIIIPLTYDCNDNCISCPEHRIGSKKNPSFEDIKKKIDKIFFFPDVIFLNGGEPTLREDFFKILHYIDQKNPKEINLLTNVKVFIYNGFAQKLKRIKNLKIITTIYGHNSKTHNSITRTPESFEHKIMALKNLIDSGIRIELRILLHKINYQYIDDIANFLIQEFKGDDFVSLFIMNAKLTGVAGEYKNLVGEKLTKISSKFEKPLLKLKENGYNIGIFHFPHCSLPKSLWVYSKGFTAREGEAVFLGNCECCVKKKECAGVWKSYLDLFGEGEFINLK